VYVPRTVFCDAHDSEAFRSNGQRWHQASRSAPVRPSLGAGGFDEASDGGMPGVSSRVTWDSCLDAAGLVLHPSCTLPVGGRSSTGDLVGSAAAASLSCASPLDAFSDGAALWDEESMLEPLRWHLEDCDALHGVVAVVDVDGGWGGLGLAMLEAARDSMLPKGAGIAVYGLLVEAGAGEGEGEADEDEGARRERRGAGAGAGAGSQSGSAYGSTRSAAASTGSAAGSFNYGTRSRAALRSINCALALHAFGREAAERIGCTMLPVGAGGPGAGGVGSGARAARLTAAAMSLLLDCTRPERHAAEAGETSAAAVSDTAAATGSRSTGGASHSSLTAGDGRVPAVPWDRALETSGGAPLASMAEGGVPLASLLAFLTQGSSGVHVATTRLAMPLTPAPASLAAGAHRFHDAAPASGSISASALRQWLPPSSAYFAAEGSASHRLETLNWGAVRAVLGSAAPHPADAREGLAAASVPMSHLAVLRGVGTPEPSGHGAGGVRERDGGSGPAASATASRSRGTGSSPGAGASGAAPAASSSAAFGRVLDGWLEEWRCPSAAHRVVNAGLPVSPCSWGKGRAAGVDTAADAALSYGTSPARPRCAAFMHVAVGADAAALLRAGAAGVATADRSVLWRYGAELDVGQLVDELTAAAEELGGGSASADGDDGDFE